MSVKRSPSLNRQVLTQASQEILQKSKRNLVFIVSLISLFALITVYLGYQNYQLRKEIKQLHASSASLTTSPSTFSTENWILYTNEKFGFSLKYPPTLDVEPREIDIKADYREHVEKCESGVLDGCGGGRWPDFKISFLRKNGRAAFDVRIYQSQGPGINSGGFSYIVSSTYRFFDEDIELEPIDDKTLEGITSTLDFFKPAQPLACLWGTEIGAGFDPEKDKDYIEKHVDELVKLSGSYFNSYQGSCENITFYTWKGQEERDKPPFEDLEACTSTCIEGL